MQSVQISKAERIDRNGTLAVLIQACGELIKKTGSQETCTASDMANTILNTFWNFKIDEIVLVLHWGLMGRFGKLYGKLTEMVVIDWFNQYDEKRDQQIEDEHIAKKNAMFDRSERTMSTETAWKVITPFIKKL
tara:strand:- start:355 stop:756 length:402 start_codon:yes stop_codon:yes gene_type:complete